MLAHDIHTVSQDRHIWDWLDSTSGVDATTKVQDVTSLNCTSLPTKPSRPVESPLASATIVIANHRCEDVPLQDLCDTEHRRPQTCQDSQPSGIQPGSGREVPTSDNIRQDRYNSAIGRCPIPLAGTAPKRKQTSPSPVQHARKRKRRLPVPPKDAVQHSESKTGDKKYSNHCAAVIYVVEHGTPSTSNIRILEGNNVARTLGSKATNAKIRDDFDRRVRHRTRADRYELKEKSDRRISNGQEKDQRHRSRRQLWQKSGAGLLHTFDATNIASKRLTVLPHGQPSGF